MFPWEKIALPARAGIGLRAPHYREMLSSLPDIAWLEIHGENYFCAGGQPLSVLQRLRAHYPLSVHCVGLSLGSIDLPQHAHLTQLKSLIERFAPDRVSDHLSWGAVDGRYFNDLLPLPFTDEALDVVCRNVCVVQEFLGRNMLVENVSSYLTYAHSTIPEWEFLAEVSRRTGCGILLDVNNIHVAAINHGFDPLLYLNAIPPASVEEIHLAGFDDSGACLIDSHSRPVAAPVWALYAQAIEHFGRVPTLIEWDSDIPPLSVLLDEAAHADRILLAGGHVGMQGQKSLDSFDWQGAIIPAYQRD